MNNKKGFSLIEILIVIGIIAILGTVVYVALGSTRVKARDTKRKVEISQIGRFLSMSCFLPAGGDGEYDLTDLIVEIKAAYPQFANSIDSAPKDPSTGTDLQSNYKYLVTGNGSNCALYANLENSEEPITLSGLTDPTAGGGSGVLTGSGIGWNGTNIYLQYSN